MAAPWSDESSTRRSALPSVRPKPRSSGSATKVALRLPSLPALISKLLGFFNSCQFRILTVMDFPLLWAGRMGVGHLSREDFRSEEHTSELQSLMRISYAVFCLKKK